METIHKRLFTCEEWRRIVEAGIFSESERLELIRGEVVMIPPAWDRQEFYSTWHAACLVNLVRLFSRLIPSVDLSPRNPLRLRGQLSEPEPDLVLLRPRSDFAANPPMAADVMLLVEVADSSLVHDRDTKILLYAEAGVPEAWLVDLNSETIFVYSRPSPAGYQEVRQFRRGNEITPEAFPEERFSVDAILG